MQTRPRMIHLESTFDAIMRLLTRLLYAVLRLVRRSGVLQFGVSCARRVPLRVWLFGLLLAALILPLPSHGANPDCGSAAPLARLTVGGVARVAYGRGVRSLHEYPGNNARSVGSLMEGAPFTVVRGPTCADEMQWWQVRTLPGSVGWAAEGQADDGYTLEPWQILVDVPRRVPDGVEMVRVNNRALMRSLTTYPLTRVPGSLHDVLPAHEFAPLEQAFRDDQRDCPAVLRRDPLYAALPALDQLPADTDALSIYPSPDALHLMVVRHLWRTLIRCDGTPTPTYGIERVSLIDPSGERLLFDLPANASLPGSPRLELAVNQVVALRWSPDNTRAVAWLRYGERTRLIILDIRSGAIQNLDDGLYPLWLPDSERITWLRRDNAVTNLLVARYDGTGRQTISLPDTLQYVDAPIPPTWNEAGTLLLACDRASKCASMLPIDINNRRTLAPLILPIPAAQARWIMSDSALLWIPRGGGTFAIQPLRGAVRMLTLALASGETIEDARPFPGGQAALVVVHTAAGRARYAVLNFETDSITAVNEAG